MTPFLETNLAALSEHSPALVDILADWEPPPWLGRIASRAGDPTAVVRKGTEDVTIHSRYNPRREGEKLAGSLPVGATVVVEGFGFGYHIEALLARRDPFRVLIIDRDASLLGAAVRARDLTSIFRDPRVRIAIAPEAPDFPALAGEVFQPLFSRTVESLSLTPWTRLDPEWFARRRRWFHAAAESVLDDVAAQCRFGLRWTRNSIVNLVTAGGSPALDREPEPGSPAQPDPKRRALITAAGPSLPESLEKLRLGGEYLVATDTSLPSLAHRGVVPREVLSIDCQQVSYHHFFRRLPKESRALFEVASPPSLLRRAERTALFLGDHPLHAYIGGKRPDLLRLDTKGGNVTSVAVDYLRRRRFREIDILGADYAYPKLAGYTNPSFLHHYFQTAATRLSPLETRIAGFALDRLPEGRRSTPLLEGYRRNLEVYVERHGGKVDERGPGHLGIRFPKRDPSPGAPHPPERDAPVPSLTEVVREYRRELSALDLEKAAGEILAGRGVPRRELEVALTLFPVAHALSVASHTENRTAAPQAATLLRRAQ
ncbi:MAG: 6-hydroxymethylpterin diphosphokinase MptE-like protein, partial [Spirochaetaceae bacterium]